MGWTSSWKWPTPTILRKDYVAGINQKTTKVVGWCGGWLKCIDLLHDRPFVICVLVRRFGKREYGYKDMDSTMGPYYYNMAAVMWLKRELAKRNMAPYNEWEADLILRHERKARREAVIKALKPGDELVVRSEFDCTNGAHFNVGDKFTFEYFSRGRIHARNGYSYRLTPGIFFPLQCDDMLPMVV